MDLGAARKDAPVSATIERIHSILDALGFSRDRALVHWWSAGEDCHSCHLRFGNYPFIFSNGKGATKELAYASALAEFVERLQCRIDILFTRAGNIHRRAPIVTRTTRRLAEISRDVPAVGGRDLGWLDDGGAAEAACLPFADVFGGRVVGLPFDAFLMMTGSTGMCAGNTPEEAISQGLCEVFERHAIHAVARGLVPGLPTIPPDALPLRSSLVRRQFAALLSSGAEVLAKDASLGGAFPVVALVIADRRSGTCQVSFGADPDFDIALSRCITEAFQGADRLYRAMPARDAVADAADFYNHPEVLIDVLMEDVGTSAAGDAFCAAGDSRAALRFAVGRVHGAGLGLYVRDCSLLGFPSYYVYVERLSRVYERRPLAESPLHRSLEAVRATLFNLPHAPSADVDRCALALFGELTRYNPLVEQQFHAGVLQAPVAASVDLRTLLVLMLIESGRIDEARALVERPRADGARPDRQAFLARVGSHLAPYAEARNTRADAGRLRTTFERAFGAAAAGASAGGAADTGPLLLPKCQSVYSCPSCPCRRYCRLDEWYRLAGCLRAGAATVDQRDVLARITTCTGRAAR